MFSILELDSLFSDGHSLTITTLSFSQKIAPAQNERNQSRQTKPKLPEDKKVLFVQNLDRSKISELHNVIIDTSNDLNSVNLDKINNICHHFSEIFSEPAQSCINDNSSSNKKRVKRFGLGHSVKRLGNNTILLNQNTRNTLQLPQNLT